MNEEWPRAFPNLPSLLEERFYLVDPVDGYQADHHEYSRTRPATLVAESGIQYLCDLYHDDQPTPVHVQEGALISLPYSMEINDSIARRRSSRSQEPPSCAVAATGLGLRARNTCELRRCSEHPYILLFCGPR